MADTKLVICEKCWGTGHVHGGDENSSWSKTCEDCHGIGFIRVAKTNADRIRAMSDKELAKEFALIAGWDRSEYEKAKRIGIEKVMLDWLKQPAEVDNGQA